MTDSRPLILTLNLDEAAFYFFNKLRRQHFPPERNFLQAHLTLFHHLPPNEPQIQQDMKEICAHQAPLALQVCAVVSIGRGVAYKIECPQLAQLHATLQQKWKLWLIPQDKKKLWPHVTVQNKVAPPKAVQLLQALEKDFIPFTAYGTGLSLWIYDNGPWMFREAFAFGITF